MCDMTSILPKLFIELFIRLVIHSQCTVIIIAFKCKVFAKSHMTERMLYSTHSETLNVCLSSFINVILLKYTY